MKKRRKNSYKLISLTKGALLFWRWRLLLCYNIMAALFILLIPAVCLIAALAQGNLDVTLKRLDKGFWLLILLTIGFSTIFPTICSYVCILHRLRWLRREELYLGVSFDGNLGKTAIRSDSHIHTDSNWFIIPSRAYAFHNNFIRGIGKFSGSGRFQTGTLDTADNGKWKISLTSGELKKLHEWYSQQTSQTSHSKV